MSGLASRRSHIESSCEGSSTSSSTSRPMWTSLTPAKPTAGNARCTASPCGSRMPALGRINPRARITSRRRCDRRARASLPTAAAIEPRLERLAGDTLVGLQVPRPRALHDVLGDRRRGWQLAPAAGRRPVAHVLLVEAGLPAPGLVALHRPVARGVWREHLIAHRQRAGGILFIQAELELG